MKLLLFPQPILRFDSNRFAGLLQYIIVYNRCSRREIPLFLFTRRAECSKIAVIRIPLN